MKRRVSNESESMRKKEKKVGRETLGIIDQSDDDNGGGHVGATSGGGQQNGSGSEWL